jgi:hypothetical protein
MSAHNDETELTPAGRRLRAALGFLSLPSTESELVMLHRWLDTWDGIGLIVARDAAPELRNLSTRMRHRAHEFSVASASPVAGSAAT